jgi:hypothetical protein
MKRSNKKIIQVWNCWEHLAPEAKGKCLIDPNSYERDKIKFDGGVKALRKILETYTNEVVTHLSIKNAQNTMGTRGTPESPGTCGADGEKAQMILMLVRSPSVGNASHPRGLGVMRLRA